MKKTHKYAVSVTLLLCALVLSSCANKQKEEKPVAPPSPEPVAVEHAPAPSPAPPAATEQPTPAPAVTAEQPAPKPVIKKHKKRRVAKAAPPPVVEPTPVAPPAPAPVMTPEAAPAVTAAPLPPPKPEEGFLEKYWMWLLGAIAVVAAAVFMATRKPA